MSPPRRALPRTLAMTLRTGTPANGLPRPASSYAVPPLASA
ncbi:hypothetical protein ACGFIE_16245 [Micromonospora sp. NPDC049275]